MNFDNFKYHKDKIPTGAKKNIFLEELKNEFTEELFNRTDHQTYFDKYDQDSVKSFLLSFAETKKQLIEHYEFYINPAFQHKEIKINEDAKRLFKAILQKKLFNLQIQWRAELIEIKEINTSWDFLFWEINIESCPFIPEITPKEVSVFKQFLCSPNVDAKEAMNYGGWQWYNSFLADEEDDDYEEMPEWYEFYDEHMQTAHLLLLPNIRGKKDEYYREIGLAELREINKDKNKDFKPYVPIPYYYSDFKNRLEYANLFEKDPYVKELFKLYYEKYNRDENASDYNSYGIPDDAVREAVQTLLEAQNPINMPGGLPWREALILCAQQCTNQELFNDIDNVYEEYLMFRKMGINTGEDFKTVLEKYLKNDVTININKQILLGRKFLGEPEDFNY
ncbi:MAG: hypothetical protein WCH34_09830 [Bacteroidota bacterium]